MFDIFVFQTKGDPASTPEKEWLKSFKLDPDNDLCSQCAKRRKVVASSRLGPLRGLVRASVGAVTAPLNMVGVHVSWNDPTQVVTVSGNGKNVKKLHVTSRIPAINPNRIGRQFYSHTGFSSTPSSLL